MYMTDFNGKRYVFFDDRVTVNGIPIPYAEMTNIAHRRGDVPAFLFDYKGRRFALPYRLDEIRSILPYFQKAAGIGVNTADAAVVEAARSVVEAAPATQEASIEAARPAVDPQPASQVAAAVVQPAPEPTAQPAEASGASSLSGAAQPATVEYAAPEPIAEPAVATEPAVMEYPASEPVQTEYAAQEPAMASEPAVFDAPVISTPYEESYVDPAPTGQDPYASPAPESFEIPSKSADNTYPAPDSGVIDPYAPPATFESAPASDDVVTFEDSAAFAEPYATEPDPFTEPADASKTAAEPYATDTDTLSEPADAFTTAADPFAVDTASFAEPVNLFATDFETDADTQIADDDSFVTDVDTRIADADLFVADADLFGDGPDTLAPDDGSDIFALGDEAPAAEDLPKKRFWTPAKIIIAVLVAVAILVVILFSCHKGGASDTQESSQDIQTPVTEETAAPEDDDQEQAAAAPAAQGDAVEATDGFTAGDEDGTMQVVLKKAYVGDAALDKLAEMGENKADYTEDDDPGYKLVLYEYEVNVTDGMLIGDPITGEMFLPDRTTEMDDWYSYDLTANQDKDLAAGELELDTGAKTTVYCAYGMPANLTEYYEKVYTDASENTIWVHYVLE